MGQLEKRRKQVPHRRPVIKANRAFPRQSLDTQGAATMLGRLGIARPIRAIRCVRNVSGVPYENMSIGVPKELAALEKRVAQTPESVQKLTKAGFNVLVEKGAGAAAKFPDAAYVAAGAQIVDRGAAYKASLVTKVAVPTVEER